MVATVQVSEAGAQGGGGEEPLKVHHGSREKGCGVGLRVNPVNRLSRFTMTVMATIEA
jgi:hypothetical protein